jgi:peptidoglycan/LPS O-acetylase OafA/YrhL
LDSPAIPRTLKEADPGLGLQAPVAAVATTPSYLPELDVLRAFAFLAVFGMHWIPNHVEDYERHGVSHAGARLLSSIALSGGVGVMLFFCLSSYLITQILLRELRAEGRLRIGAFYMRRVLRIWPLYFSFTALATALPLVDPSQRFGWKACLAFLFFGGNWIWSFHVPVQTIATPLWSISVEEQFYLCWPWLVRWAGAASLWKAALALIALAAANRVLVVTGVIHTDLWHNTFTQLDSIALGALLAHGVGHRADALKVRYRWPIMALALLSIEVAQFVKGEADLDGWSYVYYPAVSLSCAVILWCVLGIKIDRSSRATRVLIALGKISYGLYVIHALGLYLADKLFGALHLQLSFLVTFGVRGAFALLLTIALASLSYRYIEEPFLRLKRRFA